MRKVKVDYSILEEKGFKGLMEFYSTLDIEDGEGLYTCTRVHSNPKTYNKMQDALIKFHKAKDENRRMAVVYQFMNIGVSGHYKEVDDDYCEIDEG